jgi:hypothetical protein
MSSQGEKKVRLLRLSETMVHGVLEEMNAKRQKRASQGHMKTCCLQLKPTVWVHEADQVTRVQTVTAAVQQTGELAGKQILLLFRCWCKNAELKALESTHVVDER